MVISCAALLLYGLLKKAIKQIYLVLILAISIYYGTWYADSLLSWSLPKALELKPLALTGYVASIPIENEKQTSFILNTQQGRILLTWKQPHAPLSVGDQWQLSVILKRIHGLQNPGSFDYEAWAFQKKLRAKGVVQINHSQAWLGAHPLRYPILYMRQKIYRAICHHAHDLHELPWLIALIIGEHQDAPQTQWQILRKTGTNHLMAIAGLHIGFIAGLVYAITSWLWRRSIRLPLLFPAHLAGASVSLLAAIGYSCLAGFSVPTQRACIMLSTLIMAENCRIEINRWQAFALALWGVLIINPFSLLTESAWLSFGTISLIIYGMNARLAPEGLWWKWGRVQWVIALGLTPLTLILFQQCSLISFIANSIAIPWLVLGVLPFCFLGGLLVLYVPTLGYLCLKIADCSLSVLWIVLEWLANLPMATINHGIPSNSTLALLILGLMLLLMPSGFPGKLLGFILFIPLFTTTPPAPKTGEAWFTLLDVGQGLSAVIQTKTHLLIFDTGARTKRADMGEQVLVPYLLSIGTKKIDMLVISHGDNDHIGGAHALLAAFPVSAIQTSTPEQLPTPVTVTCQAGMAWQWDHVYFKFLHPDRDNTLPARNNDSCVLLVRAHHHAILLTGDIEKEAEKILLTHQKRALQAEILIAPHHGSHTSSTPDFVKAVHPKVVLYATGYLNRYHFPHPQTIATYAALGALQLNTAETGAIQYKLLSDPYLSRFALYRHLHYHYWMSNLNVPGHID